MLSSSAVKRLESFEPELIFFDIDGTLLNTQGHFSPQLKQELQRLKAKGVKLAIASGRPAIAAQFIFDELPITDAGLFCTGAEIYDPSEKKHLQITPLDKAQLLPLCEAIAEQNIYCEFYTSDYYSTESITDITIVHSQHLRVKPQEKAADAMMESDEPITKLLLGINQTQDGDKLTPLSTLFPEFEFAFAHFLPRPDWLFASVVSSEACKKQGFQRLIEAHQVNPDRVMSFGDSHSDMCFLESAGLGVAMGNASSEVKECANITTLSSDEHGVAVALNYLYSN